MTNADTMAAPITDDVIVIQNARRFVSGVLAVASVIGFLSSGQVGSYRLGNS
ncbi:hypothetical protein EV187_1041 [Agromyces ramosus]|uniref:Uncharacterized protein n=1 Tax=Agromyces ramosus TaxID=33879 RepID=A0A4V2F035_9MICO|nr:hypothetical protein EV187_1041 [Agromyces ramosus]